MKKLAIIGGLGAASTIAAAVVDAERGNGAEYNFRGYINDKDNVEKIQGYPVLGGLEDIGRLVDQNYYFLYSIYKIDGQLERIKLFESLNIPEDRLASFIHPKAYVAHNTCLGPGCVVMPNASVSSGVIFGKNCRVMSGAMIGHDNIIEDHSFFAANATVGSHINLGRACYIGLNATIGGKLKIGAYSVVGMGSVVTKDVETFSVCTGIPAKHIRYVNDKPVDL